MNPSDGDESLLSEAQKLALRQFTSVTNQEDEAAIPVLQRSEWNVQIAIARFFDGESAYTPSRGDNGPGPNPLSRVNRRQERLLSGLSSSSRPSRSFKGLTPAPRIVPKSDFGSDAQLPSVLALLLFPVNRVFRWSAQVLSYFLRGLPWLNRLLTGAASSTTRTIGQAENTVSRRTLNSQETATRFVHELEREYGPNLLTFRESGYAQAFDLAQKDLKFLLIVLLSPEHGDTSSFVKETLLSPEVVDFVTDPTSNIILWGGSVSYPEPYQVSAALNCTKFPFAALIVHTPQVSSTAMSVVARFVGPSLPAAFVAGLREAISQHSEGLSMAKVAKLSRDASKSLREEQTSAYEKSLAQDRERARRRREEERERKQTEHENQQRLETARQQERDLQRWRQWRARQLAAEPEPKDKGSIRISIRLLSGERVVRRFALDTNLEDLYAFIECYDILDKHLELSQSDVKAPEGYEHVYTFRLISPMPRKVYEVQAGIRLGDCISRNSNLVVEPIDDEE